MILLYDGLYELHRSGRIINTKTGAEIYGTNNKYGFNSVKLRYQGRSINHQRHRLVAKHFVPNPEQLRIVHFKNGDKEDCRAENLYWGYKLPFPEQPLAAYDFNGNRVKLYRNIWEATLDGHYYDYICRCLSGINKTHHELIWRYDEGPTIDAQAYLDTRWQRRAGHVQRKE